MARSSPTTAGSPSRAIAAGVLVTAFVGALLVGALSLLLARDGGPLLVDRSVDAALGRTPTEQVALLGTVLGLPGTLLGSLAIAVVAGGAMSLVRRTLVPIVLISTALAGSAATALVLKRLVERVAPRFWLDPERVSGVSFPSSHVARATAVLAIVTVLVDVIWGRRYTVAVAAVSVLTVLATATAQVYLRVHWFTDIAGGVAVGAFWAAVLAVLAFTRLGSDTPGQLDRADRTDSTGGRRAARTR